MPEDSGARSASRVHPVKVGIEDVVPNRRLGGDIRVLLSPATAEATSGFMGVAKLRPGERITEHYHPFSEEFIYVARGSLLVGLDGEPLELARGEALMVPLCTRHWLTSLGKEEAFIVFFLSPLAPRPELGHVETRRTDGCHAPATGGRSR